LVITEEKDFITNSNSDGSFEVLVDFPAGLSQIKIMNFDTQGQFSESFVDVVFSSEFLKDINDEIDLNKKPVSYVGTVTDISGETIQIKDLSGEIKQASVEEETTYINGLKKNIEVKPTDLAIGDYIVAMGFVNGNKVLKTKRILISSPLKENKYTTIWGNLEKVTKTKITLQNNESEVNEITLPKKWNGPDVKVLKIGQNIIVTGQQSDGKFDLRSIFVIE